MGVVVARDAVRDAPTALAGIEAEERIVDTLGMPIRDGARTTMEPPAGARTAAATGVMIMLIRDIAHDHTTGYGCYHRGGSP